MQVISMYVRHREIKEKTKDRIVVTDSVLTIWCVLEGLFMIIFYLCWVGLVVVMAERGVWYLAILLLFMTLMCGDGILKMLQEFLIKKTVIIDRKLHSVIIERDSFIKYIKSIKKITFLDIECIEIWIDIEDGRSTGHSKISLSMIHENEVEIYDGDNAPTEKLANKIRNITEKQIARENNSYSSMPA